MANSPFDLVAYHPLEKLLADDLNQSEAQLWRAVLSAFETLLTRRLNDGSELPTIVSGFVGQGLQLIGPSLPGPGGTLPVVVSPGLGLYADPTAFNNLGGLPNLNDDAVYKPIVMSTTGGLLLAPAPGAGQERYDLVEVRVKRALENPQSRDVWNALPPPAGAFTPQTITKTLSYDIAEDTPAIVPSPAPSTATISVKQGVAAATGTAVVPSVTAGYLPLGVVYVPTGTVTVPQNLIRDARSLLYAHGGGQLSATVSCTTGGVPTATLLSGPAGVRFSFLPGGTGALTGTGNWVSFEFVVVGNRRVNPRVFAYGGTGVGSGYVQCNINSFTTRAATGGDQTALAAGSPPIAVAVGEIITLYLIDFAFLAPATPPAYGTPVNPTLLTVEATIRE